jgi:hypothetical protein
MQAYNDRDNNEKVEELKSIELHDRAIMLVNTANHNRRMQDFKLRRAQWRKPIQSLLLKMRHINKCSDSTNCRHVLFELGIPTIDYTVSRFLY